MRQQEIHLVSQNLPALQVDVFRMGRGERNGQQLDSSLFWGAAGLEVVTPLAGGHHVGPPVLSAMAQRFDVIPGELEVGKLLSAIQAKAASKRSTNRWSSCRIGMCKAMPKAAGA